MKPSIFANRGRPASEAELGQLEQLLGFRVPVAYRAFLAEANGGRLMPSSHVVVDGRNLGVREFFALDDAEAAFTPLPRAVAIYRGRVPRGFIPIGDDPAGNLWCVDATGDTAGAVWFWQHEFEADEGEEATLDNMIEIASNFDAFLDRIASP